MATVNFLRLWFTLVQAASLSWYDSCLLCALIAQSWVRCTKRNLYIAFYLEVPICSECGPSVMLMTFRELCLGRLICWEQSCLLR